MQKRPTPPGADSEHSNKYYASWYYGANCARLEGVARSIYVPLLPRELALLAAMAELERRSPHEQAAYLIGQALIRWQAERALEGSLGGENEALEEVA